MIKYFRFDYDYVLWGISYMNLVLLMATTPSVDEEVETKKKESEEGDGEVQSFADLGTYLNMK